MKQMLLSQRKKIASDLELAHSEKHASNQEPIKLLCINLRLSVSSVLAGPEVAEIVFLKHYEQNN